jgi:3-oxoacyl-[acyl-carrier-protein] synthase II
MTGHLLGAAGAIEAILAIKSITDHIIPPTINIEELDTDIPETIQIVKNKPMQKIIKTAMSNAFGFGGHNATLVFRNI